MKRYLFLFLTITATQLVYAQTTENPIHTPDPAKKTIVVDASCGQCQFGLKDKKGCDLAIKIKGKAYFVEGTSIDDHGDAHGTEGFCEVVRKAAVQGEIVGNKFKATYFKLLTTAELNELKKKGGGE